MDNNKKLEGRRSNKLALIKENENPTDVLHVRLRLPSSS